MVLKNYIKLLTGTLLFLGIVLMFSCEQLQTLTFKCTECTTDAPVDVYLTIKLEEFDYETEVKIYEGNLEDSILFDSYSTNLKESYRTVPINKNYTVTARYYYQGSYYVAVNTVSPHIQYEPKLCDNPCYIVYNNVVNLRLKYTK
jgi:hypothetical protein